MQWPKRCVTTNNNRDENSSLKNHTQNIAHQASSQKFRQIRGANDKFPDFFRIGTLIDSTYMKLLSLRSNLLRLRCTCTAPTTSGKPHGGPLV